MKRVVVTGIGAVTPLAGTFALSWDMVRRGVSGIGRITRFDASGLPWQYAGEVKDFDPSAFLTRKETLRYDPFIQYAVAAATMAAEDARLLIPGQHMNISPLSSGVVIGSSRGGIMTIERESKKLYSGSPSRLSPYVMPSSTIGMAASVVAQKLGIRGACLGISNACASGSIAVGEACHLVRHGCARIVIAGGTEAPLCRISIEGYGRAGALSQIEGPGASRPFDKNRDGFVLSEGAAVLVIEDLESALSRNAPVYGEVIGYSNTTDAFHITAPDLHGQIRAMEQAIDDAGITVADIDAISAHSTSTPIGDKVEASAIRRVFRERTDIPLSAVKSMTGHMLAASGAFEIACALMSLREGIIPPTLNLTEPDPECAVNVSREARQAPLRVMMTHSFGFGGMNAVLVLKRQ